MAKLEMAACGRNRARTFRVVWWRMRDSLHRWFSGRSARRPGVAPTVRSVFEARYANELFLADELLSRGGPSLPEDQVWLDRFLAAYESSSEAVYDPSRDIPDPWAPDTQPEIFEAMPELVGPDVSPADTLPPRFLCDDETDPVAQARELREESSRLRKELRLAVAALAPEREQIRRAIAGLANALRSVGRRDD